MAIRSMARCSLNWVLALLVSSPLLSAQLANYPDLLYLRFNEGAGTTTANDAVPGSLGPPVLSAVTGWITNPAEVCLGNASFAPAQLTANPTALTTGTPPALGNSPWTFEFAIALAGQPALPGSMIVITEPTILFTVQVNPRPGNTWDLLAMIPTIGPTGAFAIPVAASSSTFSAVQPWTFFSVVHDPTSSTITIYRDGQFDTVTVIPPTVTVNLTGATWSSGFLIGQNPLLLPLISTPVPRLDEIRFWGSARTAAQIAATAGTEFIRSVKRLLVDATQLLPIFPTGALITTGIVRAIIADDGTVFDQPGYDPIIGSPFSINGTFVFSDGQTYSDAVLSAQSISFYGLSSSDQLDVTGVFAAASGGGTFSTFTGPLGAQPALAREVRQTSAPQVVRFGNGSPALADMEAKLASGQAMSFVMTIDGAPIIRSFEFDFAVPTPTPRAVAATDGAGSFEIGLIDAQPGAPYFNLFSLFPLLPVGSGGFLGLEVSSFLILQLNLPSPTPPFRGAANGDGAAYFAIPPGTIAPGTIVDSLTVVLDPPSANVVYLSPITRLVF